MGAQRSGMATIAGSAYMPPKVAELLLTCLMYVDLNPIRAGVSDTLEESDFTSIQDRLLDFSKQRSNQQPQEQQVTKTEKHATIKKNENPCVLLSFKGGEPLVNDAIATLTRQGLPFSLLDYFELIDWTGRMIREDKKGAIPPDVLPILRKLGNFSIS